eukprot:CAMPEP_0115005160 /NCGR_PEP_ID=MMETSP0216-20121206/19690_1 /TAXON_ID=223996 /ORGANISM="Protocruzia adherens, Strain Boccale" /LENGTH=258 /DNA_ID=CAMNT_0002371401 /DNA_START=42 /DNA_END=818 /DNA_ORIENTATION=+
MIDNQDKSVKLKKFKSIVNRLSRKFIDELVAQIDLEGLDQDDLPYLNDLILDNVANRNADSYLCSEMLKMIPAKFEAANLSYEYLVTSLIAKLRQGIKITEAEDEAAFEAKKSEAGARRLALAQKSLTVRKMTFFKFLTECYVDKVVSSEQFVDFIQEIIKPVGEASEEQILYFVTILITLRIPSFELAALKTYYDQLMANDESWNSGRLRTIKQLLETSVNANWTKCTESVLKLYATIFEQPREVLSERTVLKRGYW